MICPRCGDEHIELMATSPVPNVWTVHQCQHCLYTLAAHRAPAPHQPRALSRSV